MKPPSFFTKLKDDLLINNSVTFFLADIPESYRKQPYNLANKLKERADLDVSCVMNSVKVTFFLKSRAN